MLPDYIPARPHSRCGAPCVAATAADPHGSSIDAVPNHELRFCSLSDKECGYSFPCDAAGHVDLDSLSERERANYFYVRALVKRDFTLPAVLPNALP